MYARVVTAQVSPDKMEEAIRVWRDSVASALKQQKGFKSGRLLVDRKTGKVVAAAVWETEADLQATGEGSAFFQEQVAKLAGFFTAPPVAEHYEVAVEV